MCASANTDHLAYSGNLITREACYGRQKLCKKFQKGALESHFVHTFYPKCGNGLNLCKFINFRFHHSKVWRDKLVMCSEGYKNTLLRLVDAEARRHSWGAVVGTWFTHDWAGPFHTWSRAWNTGRVPRHGRFVFTRHRAETPHQPVCHKAGHKAPSHLNTGSTVIRNCCHESKMVNVYQSASYLFLWRGLEQWMYEFMWSGYSNHLQ